MSKIQLKQTEICGEQDQTIGEIPEGWTERFLEEIAIFKNGKCSPDRSDEYFFPVFGSNGVIGYSNEHNSDDGTVVIGRVGSYCGSVYYSKDKCWVTDNAIIGNAKESNDSQFLYYLLLNLKLNQHRSGSGQPLLNQGILNSLQAVVPEHAEQCAIAKILSDLDAKIELNHQMNKTLESIAQALFKRWFVDFEFPGYEKTKFVDGLPEGWRLGKFGELAKIQPGYAFKSADFITEGYRIIKIRNIQDGIVDMTQTDYVSDKVYQSVDQKFHLVSGDVIIAMTGAEIGKIGIIPMISQTMLLNQRVGKLVSDYFLWAYLTLNGVEIQSLIQGISSASSAQPNISNSDIENTEVLIPDVKILDQFSLVGQRIYEKLINNLGENKSLSQIRDSLLPRLMSGKIRVK